VGKECSERVDKQIYALTCLTLPDNAEGKYSGCAHYYGLPEGIVEYIFLAWGNKKKPFEISAPVVAEAISEKRLDIEDNRTLKNRYESSTEIYLGHLYAILSLCGYCREKYVCAVDHQDDLGWSRLKVGIVEDKPVAQFTFSFEPVLSSDREYDKYLPHIHKNIENAVKAFEKHGFDAQYDDSSGEKLLTIIVPIAKGSSARLDKVCKSFKLTSLEDEKRRITVLIKAIGKKKPYAPKRSRPPVLAS
ncbi:MAG: hypothetical protein PHY92_11050, partial [Alphaproteobacteria bacterium]|nr:hypothetical protein [Alphaproteobacteria bacterium]